MTDLLYQACRIFPLHARFAAFESAPIVGAFQVSTRYVWHLAERKIGTDRFPETAMDAQTMRRLQQLLNRLGLPDRQLEEKMAFEMNGQSLLIELVDRRPLMTIGAKVASTQAPHALQRLLERCQPERTGGIPVRAWVASGHVLASCAPPADCGDEVWEQCVRALVMMVRTSLTGRQ